MKKLFNVRYIFIHFILVILGILVARAISYCSTIDTLILIILSFMAVNLLILTILFGLKYGNVFLQITNCLVVFVMAISSTLSYTSYLNKNFENITDGEYSLVAEAVKVDYDRNIVYLKNVEIEEINKSLRGEVRLYIYKDEVIEGIGRGDRLSAYCDLYSININDRFVGSNQTAVAFAFDTDKIVVEKSERLKDKFKQNVWGILDTTNSSTKVKEIEFAMLFGDKDRMDSDTSAVYSETGLAHILAVSGLHIGFVVALVYALIKRILKNKHWTSLVVTSVFIIVYLYLCDFAISAVRAVLMTMVVLYSKAKGKQYDPLCGLSIAGGLILLIHPFDLFNVGFQLSFAVVFALFCLSPPIGGMLSKIMPEKLANSLAVCVSTFVGSILIIAYYFKNCSLLAILSNLIIIPVVSISFTLLLVFVILASIFSPLKFLLVVPNLLFECINSLVYSIAELGMSAILLSTNLLGVVLGLILIFVLSDYFFLNKRQKMVLAGVMLCVICMTVVHSTYRILENGGYAIWNLLN